MGQTNARRVETTEGGTTFISHNQEGVNREIDSRISHANCYLTVTRDVDNLIQKTEYFRDAARTNLAVRRVFTRISGIGGVKLISTITSTFYEEDGTTLDSTVTCTSVRTSNATLNRITDCDAPMTTAENTKL